MNEPIKELAEKAGINFGCSATCSATLDGNDIARFVTTSDMEKFAKLIIRECIDQIINQDDEESMDDWDRGYVTGLRSAVAVISEHFGVEV